MKEEWMIVADRLYRHVNPESAMCTPNIVYITTEKWHKEWVKENTNIDFFDWCIENKAHIK